MTAKPEHTSGQVGMEFILLTAFLMSLVALSTDMVLPALEVMAADLGSTQGNDRQAVISVLFLGLTLGQLLYGPLSDQVGRKPAIALGFAVFLAGCVLSGMATGMTAMLAGRLLQGFGAAAMKVVIVAVVRDRCEGAEMARVLSLAMSVFILVPCIAPLLGQGLLSLGHWRMLFVALFSLAALLLAWFWLRQPESLSVSQRLPMGIAPILSGVREVCANRIAMTHALAAGLLHGAFIGYLLSAQQVFHDVYDTGQLFPLYFALLALALGAAYFLNARLVLKLGMRRLSTLAVAGLILSSALLLSAGLLADSVALVLFLATMGLNFFCIGFAFGNLNAIAIQPLGDIAGIASSALSFIASVISLVFGAAVGAAFDQSVLPLAGGFLLAGLAAAGLLAWGGRPAVEPVEPVPTRP